MVFRANIYINYHSYVLLPDLTNQYSSTTGWMSYVCFVSIGSIVPLLNKTLAILYSRQATNAMLSMSALLILLFVCVFWSGMLKQKNSYMYPAQDGSWQSAEQKDKLFSVNIKGMLNNIKSTICLYEQLPFTFLFFVFHSYRCTNLL